MFWLLWAAALGAAAGGNREYADRDDDGMPICGGCRNQIPEQATTCEHCSAKVAHSRRAVIAVSAFGGIGFASIIMGLLFGLIGLGIIGNNLAAGFVSLLMGLLFTAFGGLLAYPAVKIHSDKPAREVDIASRLPLPTVITDRLSQHRGGVGIALIGAGGVISLTGVGAILGVPIILAGVGVRRL